MNMLPPPLSSTIARSNVLTVKLHDAVFPAESVAVQVTVVTPAGKTDPEAGLHTMLDTAQLSDAVGAG